MTQTNKPKLKCPHCGCPFSKVTDSRPIEMGIVRRRDCAECSKHYRTIEIIYSHDEIQKYETMRFRLLREAKRIIERLKVS